MYSTFILLNKVEVCQNSKVELPVCLTLRSISIPS